MPAVFGPIPAQVWSWPAVPLRIIDGDTIHAMLDLGFRQYQVDKFRLLGINCPELHPHNNAAHFDPAPGLRAKAFTEGWLHSAGVVAFDADGRPLTWTLRALTLPDPDDFGRWLVVAWRTSDGTCLNQALLDSGNAVRYP